MKYETNFNLKASVMDKFAAQRYLSSDDMTVYLKDDDRVSEFKNSIVHIEWQLDNEYSGRICLYTSARLTEDELKAVSEWVSGQNSDGLGEGFEQQPFANYQDEDYDEDYDEEEWVMASFDWETNDYIFKAVDDYGSCENTKEEKEMNETINQEMNNKEEKEMNELTMKAKDYVDRSNTLAEAIEKANHYTQDELGKWFDRYCDDRYCDNEVDLFHLLKDDLGNEIYDMEDLNDHYCDMTVTEILENLSEIDTNDSYFNADRAISSDNLWDLVDEDPDDIVYKIFTGEICMGEDSGAEEILKRGCSMINEITALYETRIQEKAKELFEKLMKENSAEVFKALSNIASNI